VNENFLEGIVNQQNYAFSKPKYVVTKGTMWLTVNFAFVKKILLHEFEEKFQGLSKVYAQSLIIMNYEI